MTRIKQESTVGRSGVPIQEPNFEEETTSALATAAPAVLDRDSMRRVYTTSRSKASTLKLSQKGPRMGQFFDPETNEHWQELHVVCIKLVDKRTLWPEEYDPMNKPLCGSEDGLFAVAALANGGEVRFPGAECARCTYNQKRWEVPRGTHLCEERVEALLLYLETQSVAQFDFKTYSLPTARNFLNHDRIFQRQIVALTTDTTPSDSYKVVGNPVRELTPEEQAVVDGIAIRFMD
jgi:hypothetical protein